MMSTLRTLVVDDSTVYRHIVEQVLDSTPGVQVVATAANGQDALVQLRRRHLDLVLLDVEMPVMDGLDTLKAIRRQHPHLPVVMLSGTSRQTASITIRALELGAYDFIPKPEGRNPDESRDILAQQIQPIVRSLLWVKQQHQHNTATSPQRPASRSSSSSAAAAGWRGSSSSTSPLLRPAAEEATDDWRDTPALPSSSGAGGSHRAAPTRLDGLTKAPATPAAERTVPAMGRSKRSAQPPSVKPSSSSSSVRSARQGAGNGAGMGPEATAGRQTSAAALRSFRADKFLPRLIVVAVSTGGPAALNTLIPRLSGQLPVPILLVQHMPPNFTASLAENLNAKSALTVKEAEAGEAALPGHVYIAPGGYHMVVQPNPQDRRAPLQIALNQDAPVQNCRPAADVLFASVAQACSNHGVLAVVLTGMGRDGAAGVHQLKQHCQTLCLTQSEDTCVVYGMPKAVDDLNLSDEQLPLAQLADRINSLAVRRSPTP